MANYSLFAFKKGGKYLMSKEEMVSDEYMPERFPMYLTDSIVKEDDHIMFRYRLRPADMVRFTDTLEFDIECPKCHDKMRLCGLPVDAYTHGLYKCRRCDAEAKRRG